MSQFDQIISVFSDSNVTFEIDGNTVKCLSNNEQYSFTIKFDQTIIVEPSNSEFKNIHLCGVLNKKIYTELQLNEFMEYLKFVIKNIYYFCSSCYTQNQFQSDTYITCGSDECDYKFEELIVGDKVCQLFKRDPIIAEFLIDNAFAAIQSKRNNIIFEPYPTRFLKTEVQLKRGNLSILSGEDHTSSKDFDRLKKVITKFTIDKIIELISTVTTDQQLVSVLGIDLYSLIRFILTSIKAELSKYEFGSKNTDLYCYKLSHSTEIESKFSELKKDHSDCVFHGSPYENWFSIMRNGVKICSDTKMMLNGAASGKGIYTATDLNTSLSYCNKGTHSKITAIGIFEIAGGRAAHNTGGNIHVIRDDKLLILRFILISKTSTSFQSNVNLINKVFIHDYHQQKIVSNKITMTIGMKKIVTEYKNLTKSNTQKNGFRIEVDSKNVFLWKVFIFGYDTTSLIGQDMEMYSIKEIELEITFPQSYPLAPPFIRVCKPRFQYLTGHVTQAGALCMEILTDKGWSPVVSIESLIISIKSEILEGGGRIDPKMLNVPYSEHEAKDSFIRVAKGHGWM